ncbi:MAG: tRNA-(ms[2]io[6]A)-hydroxylase [Pseudomonadota bacterium]
MTVRQQQCRRFADDVPGAIQAFLAGPSDPRWAEALARDLPALLIDHANCELKAASTAMSLLHRHSDQPELTWRLSRLAREELRHYEQVSKWLVHYGVVHIPLSAAAYASGLRASVRNGEPGKLVDTLIIGAFIEARSCERFALIAPLLDAPLAKFYRGLLASEARHFEHYLALAEALSPEPINARVAEFREREQALVDTPASDIRFHSGPPLMDARLAVAPAG